MSGHGVSRRALHVVELSYTAIAAVHRHCALLPRWALGSGAAVLIYSHLQLIWAEKTELI
jgi:hypothetical protein